MPCIMAGMDQMGSYAVFLFKIIHIPVVAQRHFPWSRLFSRP